MIALWAQHLLKLQELDLEIRNLKLRLTMIPKEIEKLQKQIAVIEGKVTAAKKLKAVHEQALQSCESTIADLQDKIAKLDAQSNLVKKNSEYQSMLGTIAMHKKAISDEETRQLELMEQLENDSAAIRKAMAAVAPETAGFRAEIVELNELTRDVKRRGRELLAKRPELRDAVDPSILPRYEQILQKGDGVPLAYAEQDKCSNCHLRLTPQTLNSLRAGAITYCDNCMHLIYQDAD